MTEKLTGRFARLAILCFLAAPVFGCCMLGTMGWGEHPHPSPFPAIFGTLALLSLVGAVCLSLMTVVEAAAPIDGKQEGTNTELDSNLHSGDTP